MPASRMTTVTGLALTQQTDTDPGVLINPTVAINIPFLDFVPEAGFYLVFANIVIKGSVVGADLEISIVLNNTNDVLIGSERPAKAANFPQALNTFQILYADGTQRIAVGVKASSGNVTYYNRALLVMRVTEELQPSP